jgi:hypothetical protein
VADSEFDKLNEETETSHDRRVQELAEELAGCEEQRTGERFVWIAVVMILFDALVFPSLRGWTSPLAIFVLELLLLFVFARRYGVKELAEWLDWLVAITRGPAGGRTKL